MDKFPFPSRKYSEVPVRVTSIPYVQIYCRSMEKAAIQFAAIFPIATISRRWYPNLGTRINSHDFINAGSEDQAHRAGN